MARQADNTAPDREKFDKTEGGTDNGAEAVGEDIAALGITGTRLLQILAQTETVWNNYMSDVRPRWERNLKAVRNEHWDNSKYRSTHYKARSKLFRPKSRSAVRKNMSTAAMALFSTDDVVSVKAEYDDDPRQSASSSVLNHVLNYRLDRTSTRAGIPWFMMAMGACFDVQVSAMCCSKQYWQYEEVVLPGTVQTMEDVPAVDEAGMPVIDPMTGAPAMRQEPRESVRVHKRFDRPMIELCPMENVIFDVAAPWYDIAQGGGVLSVRYPMQIGDFRSMMKQNSEKSQTKWVPVPENILRSASEDYNARGVREAREGARDSKSAIGNSGSGQRAKEHDVIWPQENFVRLDGIDFHFWSIGTRAFCSTVQPTYDVYPQMFGARPYVIGVGVVEPHVPVPMGMIESVQPLQQEMNDIVNLRLDAVKQAVEPIAKIKAGSVFDVGSLRNRGAAGTNITVRNMDDLEFDRWPDASAGSYQEMAHLNADFDDVSGSFSGSSVQTNRSLNETVGGMKLLSGAANSLTEFDLRVYAETWVEPVLRQTLLNIQAFESDEVVLAVAGSRAGVNIEGMTEDDLATECNLRVNVGVGAADPMQGIAKLNAAVDMLGKVAPFFDRQVKVNAEEFVREVMGKAGYKDGMRFVVMGEPGQSPQQPSPEEIKAQMEQALHQMDNTSAEKIADEKNQTALTIEQMRLKQQAIENVLHTMAGQIQQQADIGHRERIHSSQLAETSKREKRKDAIGLMGKGLDIKNASADRQSRERQFTAKVNATPPRASR